MTQKERQERSKREILVAAMEEFGTHDYEVVTMDSICGNHGISKGMMYHYYPNKDALFLLCVQTTFQDLRDNIQSDVETRRLPAPAEPAARPAAEQANPRLGNAVSQPPSSNF